MVEDSLYNMFFPRKQHKYYVHIGPPFGLFFTYNKRIELDFLDHVITQNLQNLNSLDRILIIMR